MALVLRVAYLALGLGQAAFAATRGQTRLLSDLERDQAEASAVLSSLLKTLQAEQVERGQFTDSLSNWCKSAESQKAGMVEAIQRRLDEAAIEVRQISSDSKRLESELSLVKSTEQEKAQQLSDATQTEQFATDEFASERLQVEKTLDAAHHALRLLTSAHPRHQAQEAQETAPDVDAVSNLMQLGSDGMTDAEKRIMGQYVDPKPTGLQHAAAAPQPQELLQTLRTLTARLQQERDSAGAEHQRMERKLWTFADHLNSTIVETRSQAAAIRMELAQRKRERTRIEGKVADLSGLLKTVTGGKSAAQAACGQQQREDTQAAKYVAAEIDAVRTALEQMSPDTDNVFLAAPAFLQVQQRARGPRLILGDLKQLAQEFPEESTWYLGEAEDLARQHAVALPEQHHAVARPAQVASASAADSALQDIEQFADSTDGSSDAGDVTALGGETRPVLSDPEQVKKIKSGYEALLSKVQQKEQSVDGRAKWCAAEVRDAKVDGAAVGRSLKRMDAKLNLVQVAMQEYAKGSQYNKQQSELIATLAGELDALSDQEHHRTASFYDALGGFAKQLGGLATELGEQPTAEERRGAELAKALLQKVESHQNFLQSQKTLWAKRKESIESADGAVQEALRTDVEHNNRRLIRLKAELSFLTSLSHAKANDRQLSERYRQITGSLCSANRMDELKSEDDALRKQASALENSYAANVAPFAS